MTLDGTRGYGSGFADGCGSSTFSGEGAGEGAGIGYDVGYGYGYGAGNAGGCGRGYRDGGADGYGGGDGDGAGTWCGGSGCGIGDGAGDGHGVGDAPGDGDGWFIDHNNTLRFTRRTNMGTKAAKNGGKLVLVRSGQSGVWVGHLVAQTDHVVTLSEARKVHYWTGAGATSGLALTGPSGGRICPPVPEVDVSGWCEIIPVAAAAKERFDAVAPWVAE